MWAWSLPVNPIQYSCKPLSSPRLAAQLVLCLTPACTVTARVPWLTSFCPTPQAGGGQLGAVRSYLTWEKTNVERRSCSPPSLSQRDGISKKGHSHALLVLGMALASAVWFAFPDFQGTSVAHFILPQQKQNILASNQAKEGRTCLWGSGKSKRADERSGRQLCIEHLLEQRPN